MKEPNALNENVAGDISENPEHNDVRDLSKDELAPSKRRAAKLKEPSSSKSARSLKSTGTVKKLDLESAKFLEGLNERANKKAFGRKVRDSEIIALAITLLTQEHLETLKEKTLSEQDRLKIAHESYQKANGKLTFDQFVGKLLRGEIGATIT